MTEALQPWHRQLGESTKAFAAFILYRDMLPGERSIEKTREKLGRKSGYSRHLELLSSKHNWVARVTAHQDHLAALKTEAQAQAIKDMAERQAKQGMVLQMLGFSRFLGRDGELRKRARLADKDALRAIEIGAKMERTARGEPTEIVEQRRLVRNSIADLTDDELDRVISGEFFLVLGEATQE